MRQVHLVRTTMAHMRDWASIQKLKSCPLCGALNVRQNSECFCCGWSGEFDSDERLLQLRVAELALVRPELRSLWQLKPSGSWWANRKNWLKGLFRRRVDLRA